MICIDFGLLRSRYCNMSYLLADIKIRVKIWQPTYDSVCEDNIWIHGIIGNVFIKRLETFFFKFYHVFTFFNFFLNFYLNVYYIYGVNKTLSRPRRGLFMQHQVFQRVNVTHGLTMFVNVTHRT